MLYLLTEYLQHQVGITGHHGPHAQRHVQEGPRGEQGHVTELVLQIETVLDNLILNHFFRPVLVGVGLVVLVSVSQNIWHLIIELVFLILILCLSHCHFDYFKELRLEFTKLKYFEKY